MATSSLDQARTMLGRLTLGQKISMAIVGLLTVGAVWGIVSLANRVRYEVLFSNLESEDAASIVQRLQAEKIAYRLDAGGTAISIPSDRRCSNGSRVR